MKKWIWLILCLVLSVQLSCSAVRKTSQTANDSVMKTTEEGYYAAGSAPVREADESKPGSAPVIQDGSVRKIIQNGSVWLEVEDPVKTSEVIQEYAMGKKGYLANANKNENQEIITIYLQIKIPVQEWTGFMSFLRSLGKVKNESISTNEITKEYYDTSARLKNAENQLKQYTQLLMKAQKIEDILGIQREIDQVQERIEQFKGQLSLWDQQVALSTIEINIRQTPTTQVTSKNPTWDFLSGSEMWKLMKNNAIIVFSSIIKFLQYLLIIILFYLLPIGLFCWFLYWLIRKIMMISQKRVNKKK